jgi:hypothetical protein
MSFTQTSRERVSKMRGLSLRHATARQVSLANDVGQKRWNPTGTLWIQIFAKVGDGLATAYSLAQTVVDAYRVARGGAVWYRNPRLNEVGTTGGHEQINVLVDFSYDDVR